MTGPSIFAEPTPRAGAFAVLTIAAALVIAGCQRGPRVELDGDSDEARARALADVEQQVRERYPSVSQLTPAALDAARAERKPIILLDVRTAGEYAVSHIEGATRVGDDASAEDVEKLVGSDIKNSLVVFYCSVGERSSRLAARTGDALRAAGAADVVNLEGGIFAWHNQTRALVNEQGPTRWVHPFNDKWGQLLVDRSHRSTSPQER